MTPERWSRVKELFQSAVEQAPRQRAAFLEAACADDADLRKEVESLLASHRQLGDFIDIPVLKGTAELLVNEPAESLVGRRIGPYQVLRAIGRGGMGAVYLATRADDEYQKRVAIKLVKRGMDNDAILRRFRQERQILACLDHPNIAKLFDGGTTADGLSYFVMDHVEGQPIDAYCDTHQLSTTERLKLFRAVCSAVHYAHQNQVIHRDLKPSNILVTVEGVPELLDFGIAKVLNPEVAGTTAGAPTTALRPMTPEYASPEQVRGGAVTPASDIYSLGVLLYELLTGHRPYRVQSHTPQELEHVICEAKPEQPSKVIDRIEEVPGPEGSTPISLTPVSVSATREGSPKKLRRCLAGDLDNIVLMALRKEPERRYASVKQLSEDIRRHLEGQPVIARKDTLGYLGTKFIKRNQAAVLAAMLSAAIVLALVVGFYLLAQREKVLNKAIDSIAVLPLVNASADPNMEYLSDGITESLINSLSQLPQLRVMARTTVFRYKGREVDPQKVGRELNVRAVLTGKVLPRGETLNIQAELVEVENGSQLWGKQYNWKWSEILVLHEEIAKQVSERLRLKLTGEEQNLLSKRYTENATAYELYQRGRYFWNRRTEDDLKKGIEYFRQAIAQDPNYALAYAGLADCYAVQGTFEVLPSKELLAQAKEAALKSLAIDNTLVEAHTSLAFATLNYDWDWSGAEREYKKALALSPNHVTAHHWYSSYLDALGRTEEAISESQRAQALDPKSLVITLNVGLVFYHARQYDRALEQYSKALQMDRTFARTHWYIGLAYVQKAMLNEAIVEFREAIRFSDNSFPLAALGYTYAVSGRRREAREVLNDLLEASKQRYVTPYVIALVYAGLGEKDQAFVWLEKAYGDRSEGCVWLKVEPLLDSLRSDSRFADLLRRVGLSPQARH